MFGSSARNERSTDALVPTRAALLGNTAGPTVGPPEPPPPHTPPNICLECQALGVVKVFGTKSGLSQHRRKAHKTIYMAERLESDPPIKERWTDEEIRLLALDEAKWVSEGCLGKFVNKHLAGLHPNRSCNSITAARKQKRYKDALKVVTDEGSLPQPARIPAEEQEPAPSTWSLALKATFLSVVLGSVDLSEVLPGQPSNLSQTAVDEDLAGWLPVAPPKVFKHSPQAELPENSRKRRRALYARTQQLWRKSRKRSVDTVLTGAWAIEAPSIDRTAFIGFWGDLLRTGSKADHRPVTPIREVAWSVLDPITPGEIIETLKGMKGGTAPGPDNRVLRSVRQMEPAALAGRFNFWMYSGCTPSPLYEGYTSFIPKVPGNVEPANFRPITVSSIITRCFHCILARRLEALCPPSLRQKAFRSGDGICENIEVFKETIRHAQHPKHPRDLFLTFLDVRKAFDSVSHESMAKAAERAGVPPPLVIYIQNLYRKASTSLRLGSSLSDPIRVGQGVRQGDPLSPILFNFVIDWALAELDPHLGFDLDGIKLNHLAFADDVVLLSKTQAGLQRQIDLFSSHLAGSGLILNAAKCSSMGIKVVGGRERHTWVVDHRGFAKVGGTGIAAMEVGEAYKYLGIQITNNGAHSKAKEKLTKNMAELTHAPLKPQQRLWILNTCVIPALYHDLVLSECTQGFLESLDRDVRAAVRTWTRLPKDTVIPYFYTNSKAGGLGIPSIRWTVPQLKVNRLSRLVESQDPVVRKVAGLANFQAKIRKWSKASLLEGEPMTSSLIRKNVWSRRLYATVDGRGLEQSSLVPGVHDWVKDGSLLLSGAKFNAALALRGGTLPTRVRASRGRGVGVPDCDHCGVGHKESLGHILQTCGRTHGARIKRHDRVLAETSKALSKLGYTTLIEPHIQTESGLRKPDIVAYNVARGISAVIDVTICTDNIEVNRAHFKKVETYAQHPEITRYVEALSGGREPFYSGVAINWRGAIAPQSAQDLRTMGVSERTLKLLSVITVEQSALIHRLFNTNTARRIPDQNPFFDPP